MHWITWTFVDPVLKKSVKFEEDYVGKVILNQSPRQSLTSDSPKRLNITSSVPVPDVPKIVNVSVLESASINQQSATNTKVDDVDEYEEEFEEYGDEFES